MSSTRRKQAAEQADQMIKDNARRAAGADSASAQSEEAPSAQGDQDTLQQEQQEGSESAESTQEEEVGSEAREQPREETAEYWKHKFKSLDGIIRQRDQTIEQMRDMLASMQQSMQQMSESQQAQAQQPTKQLVTKEDEDAFGADLVEFMQRVAQQALSNAKEELRSEFSGLSSEVSKVTKTVQATAQERFEAALDKHADGWRELDRDQAFIDWLKASPTRQQHWALSINNLDALAAAEMFQTYKLLNDQAAAERNAPRNKRKAELERQVAPGKSRSTTTGKEAEGEPKRWTASEISHAFENRKSYGAQEWAATEREIFKAQAEGRVDYSK